jgi:hypothetical protein
MYLWFQIQRTICDVSGHCFNTCFISGCKNEAKPLASVTCGSGSQRCPGGYQCSSPPSGGAGVCCRRGKYRVSNKMKSTKYHTVRAEN